MSINLRIYADQIYGFTQSYMKEYISPEIVKEEFINNFKSGQLNYETISTKKSIRVNPQVNLEELNIQNLEIKIPNETENLSLFIGKLKGIIDLQEIKDEEIENIIINERKNLIEGFINFVIKKIEKKGESKTFIEGLIETFVNRAINGLVIDLNNIELMINFKKYIICFDIEKFLYSEEKGIQMNNFSISLMEEEIKKEVLKKFSLNIELKMKQDKKEENKEGNNVNDIKEENNIENNNKEEVIDNRNILNITIKNIEFEINQDIIYAFNDIYDLFNTTEYKKIFLRYKKLIQFHKPKINEDKHNNYISLWYYAIKTVIKLQKYIGRKKHHIFDLIESSQIKIIKKYIDDNNNINNLLLPNEINSLKATKEKVEKQLLENKKGGGIAKAFSFFFGGGGDDDKKELTEEEKNELNEMYTDDYIIKYILGLNDGQKSGANPFSDKINKIINDLIINIKIDKIEVKENNYNCNFFIKTIDCNCNLINKKFDFEINIDDVGTLINESLFSDKFEDTNYLIQIKKEINSDKIKLNLGFNNIVLNEDMFIFFLTYFSTLKSKSNMIKLFHKTDYSQFINKEINKETKPNVEEINNIVNEKEDDSIQLSENFSISNIPSLTLINTDKNKLELNIQDFIFNKNNLSFSLNIQDSFGTILDNYAFNFNIEKIDNKQKYKFYLEQPINIIISKDSSFFIFLTYLKLKEIPKNVKPKEEFYSNNNDEIYKLFCFNYVEYKDINIDFNNYYLDFLINDLNIELSEKKCSSFILLKKLNLKYENKNLLLNIEKIEGNIDYLSDIILYILDFKSKDFNQYQKLIPKKIINDTNEALHNDNNIPIQNEISNIKTNYNIKLSDVISHLNLEIGIINFGIKIEENIIYANIYRIKGKNNSDDLKIINISINNACLYVEKKNILNEKYNILNLNKPTLIDYNLTTELFNVKLDSPLVSLFIPIISSILTNLEYLLNQIDWTVIICKIAMEIFNSTCKINVFNFLINYIYISNFDGKTTDTFFLTIKDFIIKNEKSFNIIEQNELSLNFTMKSKTEDYLGFKFKGLKTNISQQDISKFYNLLESNKKEENNINSENINNNNLDIKNEIKEEKEYALVVDGNINNINIGFCLDDYTNKSNLNLNNINLFIKNGKIKKEEENLLQNIFDCKIIFDRINLKYYDDSKKEIEILNYFSEIKKKVNTNLKNDNLNQIEIISKDNMASINLNNNNINLRLDCFLYLYYFITKSFPSSPGSYNVNTNQNFFIDLLKPNEEKENSIMDTLNIQINLNKTRFKIQTSFEASENLFIKLEDLTASYNPKNNISLKLDSITSSFESQKHSRELFHTNKDFLFIKCSLNKNKILDIESLLGTIIINLSYQDIISFLQCYLINKVLFQKINSINKEQPIQPIQPKPNDNLQPRTSILNSVVTMIDSQKNSYIKLKLSLNNIFFTLVDNSSLNYHPFINGSLNKMLLNYNQINSFELSYELALSSYNYISSKWEPILENLFIKLKHIFSFDDKKSENDINIDIGEVNLNLSDMAISSMLIIFQHWAKKFIEDEKEYSKKKVINSNNNIKGIKLNFNKEENNQVISKMTNTSIINITGMDLKIKYNKKIITLKKDSKWDLEYIIDWDINKLGRKQISIMMENYQKEFKILFEELGNNECDFDNFSLISENTLTKDRHINISIYSPIIIKNKTLNNIRVQFMNSDLGIHNELLKPNNIIGINHEYYNKNTFLNLILIKSNGEKAGISDKKIFLKDIIENDEFSESLFLGGKFFYIKLVKKLKNLKEILITFEYCIVNALPCELSMINPKENKTITIKKYTQYFIDFYADINTELIFKIKISDEDFYSVTTKFFKANEKQEEGDNYFTEFNNRDKTKCLRLAIQYNKSKNSKLLIIYSESFLYNYSGVNFNIYSEYEENPLLFNLGNNLYLITSKIDNFKNAFIQLQNNKYSSTRISLDDINQSSPSYKLKLINNRNILNLSIKREMSYLAIRNNPYFKQNIMVMVYKIYPFCRITNLLTSKNLLIADESDKNNYIIINYLREKCFNFFEKGKNITLLIGLINTTTNEKSDLIRFKLTSCGIFTFCIENTIFNIEVKESNTSELYDIFVVESNLENAKIVVENMTDSNFIITQDKFDRFRQILNKNDKQILKIYDQDINCFIITESQTNISYRFSFNSFREEEHKLEKNNFIFIKESNGMKMKLTILNKENFNQIKNYNINIGLKLKVQNVFISVIGDNEYESKKLRNYERYELLLMHLNQAKIDFNLNHYSGLLDNDKFAIKLNFENMVVYNQKSEYGKFSNVFKNISSPMCKLETEIIDYKNSSMSKINKFEFNMGKLKLSIDPNFIDEIINFRKNIFYRMEIIDFNIDEIFLPKDRDIKINKQFENYLKENSIYFGNNFYFPKINLNFELNEVGLKDLLKTKLNTPQYLIWLGSGLVGKEHNINISNQKLDIYFGSMKNLIEKIILMYKEEASFEMNKIGIKGFIGQIEQFFTKSNKTDEKCTDVQRGRIRHPRAFYGKYKYFKKYNMNDAKYLELIEDKFNLEKSGIYLSDFILDKNYSFCFTDYYLLILENDSLNKYNFINYFFIDSAVSDKNKIIVYLNKEGKNQHKVDNVTINCENEVIAQNISKLLNENSKINIE